MKKSYTIPSEEWQLFKEGLRGLALGTNANVMQIYYDKMNDELDRLSIRQIDELSFEDKCAMAEQERKEQQAFSRRLTAWINHLRGSNFVEGMNESIGRYMK